MGRGDRRYRHARGHGHPAVRASAGRAFRGTVEYPTWVWEVTCRKAAGSGVGQRNSGIGTALANLLSSPPRGRVPTEKSSGVDMTPRCCRPVQWRGALGGGVAFVSLRPLLSKTGEREVGQLAARSTISMSWAGMRRSIAITRRLLRKRRKVISSMAMKAAQTCASMALWLMPRNVLTVASPLRRQFSIPWLVNHRILDKSGGRPHEPDPAYDSRLHVAAVGDFCFAALRDRHGLYVVRLHRPDVRLPSWDDGPSQTRIGSWRLAIRQRRPRS